MFRHLRPALPPSVKPAQSSRYAVVSLAFYPLAKLSAMQIAATCLLAQHPPLLPPVSPISLIPHASRQFLVLTLLSLSLSFYCIVSASLPRPTSAGASNPMLGVPFRVDHRIAHACFLFFSNYCFAFVHFGW